MILEFNYPWIDVGGQSQKVNFPPRSMVLPLHVGSKSNSIAKSNFDVVVFPWHPKLHKFTAKKTARDVYIYILSSSLHLCNPDWLYSLCCPFVLYQCCSCYQCLLYSSEGKSRHLYNLLLRTRTQFPGQEYMYTTLGWGMYAQVPLSWCLKYISYFKIYRKRYPWYL